MKKALKIWIIVAVSLVLIGSLIFTGAMASLDFDFKQLSTENFETNTYELKESFDKISIDVEISDITFVPSDNKKCKVVCYEKENLKHTVEVENETLKIATVDTQKWYDHIGVFFNNMTLTVYLPEKEYSSLMIDTATGDVEVPESFEFESVSVDSSTGDINCYATADSIDVDTTTGSIQLSDLKCKNVKANTTTGEIQLSDVECESVIAGSTTGKISFSEVLADEKLSADSNTGDVTFDNSDAESITVNTSTGDVTGTLLSEKNFRCETSTGDIDVPETTSGGICRIATSTGDINISIT